MQPWKVENLEPGVFWSAMTFFWLSHQNEFATLGSLLDKLKKNRDIRTSSRAKRNMKIPNNEIINMLN